MTKTLLLKMQLEDGLSPKLKKSIEEMQKLYRQTDFLKDKLNTLKDNKKGFLKGAVQSDLKSLNRLQAELNKLRAQYAKATPAQRRVLKPQLDAKGAALEARYANQIRKVEKALRAKALATQKATIRNTKYYNSLTREQAALDRVRRANNRAAVAAKRFAKANRRVGNDIVRHIRMMESYVVAFYGLYRAYGATLGVGHEYNKLLENETAGMKILVVQSLADTDAMGRRLSLQKKYNIAQKEAVKMVDLARKINPETPYNLQDTIKTYKALFPQLIKYGAKLEDIAEITKKVTILGKAMNLDTGQFIKTIDTAFTGKMKPSQMQIAMGMVGITNQTVKEWQKQGTLVQNLLLHLKDINAEMSGISVAWDTATSNFKTQWQELWKELQKPMFDSVKSDINSITGFIRENKSEIVSWTSTLSRQAVLITAAYLATKSLVKGIVSVNTAYKTSSRRLALMNLRLKASGREMTRLQLSAVRLSRGLKGIFIANAPMAAMIGLFELWNYWSEKQAEKQEYLNSVIFKGRKEIEQFTVAQAKMASQAIDSKITDLTLKQQDILYKREHWWSRLEKKTNLTTEEQARLDTLNAQIATLKQQKAQYDRITNSLYSLHKLKDIDAETAYKSANGAKLTKEELQKAANAALTLAQNLNRSVAQSQILQAQAANLAGKLSGDALSTTIGQINLDKAKQYFAELVKASDGSQEYQVKLANAYNNILSAQNNLIKIGNSINQKKLHTTLQEQAAQKHIFDLKNRALTSDQIAIRDAQRKVEIAKREMEAAKSTAQYQNKLKAYQEAIRSKAELEANQTRQSWEQATKDISKSHKDLAKDAQSAYKDMANDAKQYADEIRGVFSSALSKIFHGDIAGGIEGLFKGLGDAMMKPAIDRMAAQMTAKFTGSFGTNLGAQMGQVIADGVEKGFSPSLAGKMAVKSLSGTQGLKPDVQAWFAAFKEYAAQHGEAVRIASQGGFRTAAQQNAIYQKNDATHWYTSKDGYIKKSVHQLGRAMDIISKMGYAAKGANTHIANLMRSFAKANPQYGKARFLSLAKDPNHVEINRHLGGYVNAGKTMAKGFSAQMPHAGKKFAAPLLKGGASCGGGAGGGLLAGIGMNILGTFLGAAINGLFHQTLSAQEIEAAKGQREFRGQDLRALANAYKDVQYPLLAANLAIKENTQKMANAFDVVAQQMSKRFIGVGSGVGGIDPTGGNYIPSHTKVLFGLFEETRELISSGFKLEIDNFVEGFTKIQTYWTEKVSSSFLFGLFTSESIANRFKNVDPKTAKAFGQALKAGFDTIVESAAALGFNKDSISAALKRAKLKIGKDGKIDTKGLSQEEASKRVSQAFNDMFSGAIEQVKDLNKITEKYQEGMETQLDTLVKIASISTNVQANAKLIGLTLHDYYTTTLKGVNNTNKFYGLLKNGVSNATAMSKEINDAINGFDSSSILMSKEMNNAINKETEKTNKLILGSYLRINDRKFRNVVTGKIVDKYTMNDSVLYKIIEKEENKNKAVKAKITKKVGGMVSSTMNGVYTAAEQAIDMAKGAANGGPLKDGLKALQAGFKSYFNNFLDEAEKRKYLYQNVNDQLKSINIHMPKNMTAKEIKAWYKKTAEGWDHSTKSANEAYGKFISIADTVNSLANVTDAYYKKQLEGMEKLKKHARDALTSAFETTSKDSLMSLTQSITLGKYDDAIGAFDRYAKNLKFESDNKSDYMLRLADVVDKIQDIPDPQAEYNERSIKQREEMIRRLENVERALDNNTRFRRVS